MTQAFSHSELVELVRKIMNCEGGEEELNDDINLFNESVPHPDASDLIFYSEEELTPEEVVDKALSYRNSMLRLEGS